MITIRTVNKITLAQALTFADEQKNRGVRIQDMFADNCRWQLEVSETTYTENSFHATVNWYQLVEYETGEGIGEMKVLIYREKFSLEGSEIQNLWETMQGNIAYTDNYLQKVQEFTQQGILIWCGTVRNIFGVGIAGFQVQQ